MCSQALRAGRLWIDPLLFSFASFAANIRTGLILMTTNGLSPFMDFARRFEPGSKRSIATAPLSRNCRWATKLMAKLRLDTFAPA